jgi:hypothetical protein
MFMKIVFQDLKTHLCMLIKYLTDTRLCVQKNSSELQNEIYNRDPMH